MCDAAPQLNENQPRFLGSHLTNGNRPQIDRSIHSFQTALTPSVPVSQVYVGWLV
jgi:hypothetical protein